MRKNRRNYERSVGGNFSLLRVTLTNWNDADGKEEKKWVTFKE